MENIQESDLDVQLNLGIVVTGKMRDLAAYREALRKITGVKIAFNTFSSEYLFIIKKSALSPEQQTNFQKKDV